MRIAVVSDVHGDLDALETVLADIRRQAPDLVLHGGDLPLLGPEPAAVVDRIRELGWAGVLGNTDELLFRPELSAERLAGATARGWAERLFDVFAPWAVERLGEERIDWIKSLPREYEQPGLRLVHASPGDLWSAPTPEAPDAELAAVYGPPRVGTTVYGHIHKAFVRTLPGLVVANSGSVGLPSDGDPRPGYVLIDGEDVQVRRVGHDLARSEARIRASGFPEADWLVHFKRKAAFSPL